MSNSLIGHVLKYLLQQIEQFEMNKLTKIGKKIMGKESQNNTQSGGKMMQQHPYSRNGKYFYGDQLPTMRGESCLAFSVERDLGLIKK